MEDPEDSGMEWDIDTLLPDCITDEMVEQAINKYFNSQINQTSCTL
jgi:hypothetical protein